MRDDIGQRPPRRRSRLLIGVALAIVVTVVAAGVVPVAVPGGTTPEAAAAAPDTSGLLVYAGCAGTGSTFSVRPDGSSYAALPLSGYYATVSPDGRLIARKLTQAGKEIVVSGLDGTNAITLTAPADTTGVAPPVWAPDGTEVAATESVTGGFRVRVWDIASQTSTAYSLGDPGANPLLTDWRGGTWAFWQAGSIVTAPERTGSLSTLYAAVAGRTAGTPKLLPGGQAIFMGMQTGVAASRTLYVDNLAVLAVPNIDSTGQGRPFAVSPDGRWVAVHTAEAGGTKVHLMSLVDSTDISLGVPGLSALTSCAFSWAGPQSHPVASASVSYTGPGNTWTFDGSASTATPPTTIDAYDWSFSDGQTATGPTPTVTFASPGDYTATLTVTDSAGVESEPTSVQLTSHLVLSNVRLSSAPDNPSVGQPVTLTATVGAIGTNRVTNVVPVLSGLDPAKVTVTSGPDASGFTLEPQGTKDVSWKLLPVADGPTNYQVDAHGTVGARGEDAPALGGSLVVGAQKLRVDVTLDPATFVQDEDIDGPKPRDVSVTVTVTNLTDHTIGNVVVDQKPALVPHDHATTPVPFPLVVKHEVAPSKQLGSLASGAKSTPVTYVLTANDDIDADVQVLATADDPPSGGVLHSLGIGRLQVQPRYTLALKAARVDDNPVTAGGTYTIEGVVENRTTSKVLDVHPLCPNAATGVVATAARRLTEPLSANVHCILGDEVRLGGGEKYHFHLLALTLSPRVGQPDYVANVSFSEPGLWVDVVGHDDAGKETFTEVPAGEKRLTQTSKLMTANVVPADPVPQSGDFVHGFMDGFYATTYVSDLLKGLNDGVHSAASGLYSLGLFVLSWRQLSEADKDIYLEAALLEARNYAGHLIDEHPELLTEMRVALQQNLADLLHWWDTADVNDQGFFAGGLTAKLVGDLTVGELTGILAKHVLESLTVRRQLQAADQAVSDVLAQRAKGGIQTDKGLAGVPASAAITKEVSTAFVGVPPEAYDAFQAIAKDEGVLILVRSRAAASTELVKAGESIEKFYGMYPKGVNDIDKAVLGFDKVPSAVTALQKSSPYATEAEVRAAAAAKGLEGPQIEAVVQRWDTRSKEWAEHGVKLEKYATPKPGEQWGSIDVPWPTYDNLEGMVLNNKPLSFRRLPFRLVDVGEGVMVPEVFAETTLPTGEKVTKWLSITGDIDIVGLMEADGTTIASMTKTLSVMNKLRKSAANTQHPATLGWLLDKSEKLLRDHLPGGEPFMVFGPEGPPRAAFFDPSKSLARSVRFKEGVKLQYLTGAPINPQPVKAVATAIPPLVVHDITNPYYSPKGWDSLGDTMVFQKGGLILRQTGNSSYEQWTPGTGWKPYRAALPLDAPQAQATGEIDPTAAPPLGLAPQTALSDPSAAGASGIRILRADVVLPDGGPVWFAAGDTIVIDPGGEHEESATIAAVDDRNVSLVTPLRYAHTERELVAQTGVTDGPVTPPVDGTDTAGAGTTRTYPPRPLAYTGARSRELAWFGLALLLAGALLVLTGRRRRARRVSGAVGSGGVRPSPNPPGR
ncbi:MAG: PKD domain-containing protein [Acidimicrobiia bacterium]